MGHSGTMVMKIGRKYTQSAYFMQGSKNALQIPVGGDLKSCLFLQCNVVFVLSNEAIDTAELEEERADGSVHQN